MPTEVAEALLHAFFAFGVAIGGAASETFDKIGIHRSWILEPQKDPYAFDAALRKVSRASRAASRGGGAFRNVATGSITTATEGFR